MGFVHERHGRIAIETRSESFKIHPGYGYTPDGNEHSDELGDFGVYWREHPHPEFLLSDLDDLIAALQAARPDAVAEAESPFERSLRELLSEVDCRIEHGAKSGGHLEYVRTRLQRALGEPESPAAPPPLFWRADGESTWHLHGRPGYGVWRGLCGAETFGLVTVSAGVPVLENDAMVCPQCEATHIP